MRRSCIPSHISRWSRDTCTGGTNARVNTGGNYSRVVLYANYARSLNYQYALVKSPDSVGVTLMFDTGTGNIQRLIDVSKLAAHLGHDQCTALMALHAFSGCDSTSVFRWIGKLKPMKTLQHLPKYIPTIKWLGDTWDIPDDDMDDLESFTCAMAEHRKSPR